ncbi:UPF0160 protein [Artemisia annua]|uniref:UPF0160 protein n=1 Tax=Artemisia annua TaxID=35608 RepID=A0A2U1KUD0_ARTAN|nr:UPF0160 protein [Artemisia annua]
MDVKVDVHKKTHRALKSYTINNDPLIHEQNLTNVLESLDAVLDVGGVYYPNNDRYDHLQKGFAEVFGHGFTTKLSSSVLIYKHFGSEIIKKELQVDEGHPDEHQLFLATYKSFMELLCREVTGDRRLFTLHRVALNGYVVV